MKIILMPNPYRDKQFKYTLRAREILEESGVTVRLCLPFDVDRDFDAPEGTQFDDLKTEVRGADMLVCFGGDGTILHASKLATANHLPILGVNIGTMGFIAELESGELELLRRLPKKEYTLEPRTMLDVTVTGASGQHLLHETALNDAVITKGAIARVVQMSVRCDGVEAANFSGDGVILCTPTGSTAYSLSAGGPVVEPVAQILTLTPICTHNMRFSSYVLSPDHTLTVSFERNGRKPIFLFVDESRAFPLHSNDIVQIRRSRYLTRLAHLSEKSFCEVFAQKMLPGGFQS